MASFVEQATLKVVDQSTSQINKINAALKKLQATARSIRSFRIDFNINMRNLQNANAELRKLAALAKQVGAASRTINFGAISAAGLRQATAAAQRLLAVQQQIARLQPRAAVAAPAPMTRGGRAAPPILGGLAPHLPYGIGGLIGYQIASKTAQAVKEGTRDVDIGDTALAIRQLGPERRQFAEKMIDELIAGQKGRPGGPIFHRGQIAQLFAESLGVVREGATQALPPAER